MTNPETPLVLPEGATALDPDELPPAEPAVAVEVAIELGARGASEELVEAVGGREALEAVRHAKARRAPQGPLGNGQPSER